MDLENSGFIIKLICVNETIFLKSKLIFLNTKYIDQKKKRNDKIRSVNSILLLNDKKKKRTYKKKQHKPTKHL